VLETVYAVAVLTLYAQAKSKGSTTCSFWPEIEATVWRQSGARKRQQAQVL